MRRAFLLIAVLLSISVASPATEARAAGMPYVVVLQDSVTDPSAAATELAGRYGLQVTYVYSAGLKGFAALVPSTTAVTALSADSQVNFVQPDRTLTGTAQTLPKGIDRVEGDRSSTLAGNGSGSVSVPMAIIDSGSTHTDLNVVGGKGCVPGSTSYLDANGHGTHVAGTAAAKDDGIGAVGIAPGAPVWSVRVLDSRGSGTTASLLCGVDWVTANAQALGIKVANMSIAGVGADDGNCGNTNFDALHQAICRSVAAGVTYVVGAGNSGTNFANTVPAAYNEVLTVTDIADFNGRAGGGGAKTCMTEVDDTSDIKSNFTTIGSPDASHTIAAPGVCIYSTYKSGKYATMSGTSMAAPHVAGSVALCIETGGCAGLAPADIITKIRSDAAAQPSAYSFTDGPFSPNGTRYYGDLVYAGGY